ncbi:MAG: LuxR C-terminal-related transcriptional regulator [Chitinophagia bacterium]|jgi:DNA-binding NarL/FixJ family response regulator
MQKNNFNQQDQRQVFICDQQAIYAMGCSQLVQAHPMCNGYRILTSLEEINNFNIGLSQGLLIIDCAMFNFDAPAVKKKINHLQQLFPCIILLNKDTPDYVLYQLIELEVNVIVSRNMSSQEWNKAVEMACQHKVYFCQDTAERVLKLTQVMDKINLIERVNLLSLYDKYILIRICEEASSKQIAAELGHSKRTIEGHRTRLMQTLEVKNVAGLVKIALITKLYEHYLANPGWYASFLLAKTSSL